MNRRLFFTALALTLLLPPAPLFADEETDAYRKQFVGRWSYRAGKRETAITRHEDGTWTSRTTDNGKVLVILSGVWWARAGKLSGVLLYTTDSNIPTGIPDSSEVIEVAEDHYTIRNHRGDKKRYVRTD